MSTMYAVSTMAKVIQVSVTGMQPELLDDVPLRWAEGMIGAIPVFATREDAEVYAEGQTVIEIAEADSE